MEVYHTTDPLVALTSKGLKKFWIGFAVTDGENHYTQSESWQLKADGTESKHITSTPNQSTAKNVGRSNEVSPHDQAILEIDSAYGRKRDSGYVTIGERLVPIRPLPMLAHPFEKRKHNISYPAMVQPKLDGTRMLFDGTTGWSRKGKDYLSDVVSHLQCELPDGIILDGELMLDQDKFSFQETISAIKKFDVERSPHLQFHVYDLIDAENPDRTFDDRYDELNGLVGYLNNPNIILVDTYEVVEDTQIPEYHLQFVETGYEGLMVRNMGGTYNAGSRSADLQKLKAFFDSEYTIIGVEEGSGKDVGTAIFLCETEDGQSFNARPRGTHKDRAEYFTNIDNYIGKLLTVRYPNLTDSGKPRFPVGISVRDYE